MLSALLAGTVSPAWADGTDPPPDPPPPEVSGTLVVGDSLTVRSSGELAALRPGWTIDGERGRNVVRLPELVADHVKRDGTPEHLVIALGTNWKRSWSKADYAAVLDGLPAETSVLFVSTYRHPKVWGRDVAARLRTYNRWMRELAADRERTGVVRWAREVQRRPRLLLPDGVHQTPGRGERVWARMVARGLDALEG